MDEKERLNALEVALNNELREREFYMKHAERTKNPFGKTMFRQIADEELEHYERLRELHKEWEKMKKWPETLPLKVKGTLVKDILIGFVKKIDDQPYHDSDDLEAVRTAIDFEAKGMELYVKLRDASSNNQEREFFDLLARIEREHYLSLKDAEEYFIDPASWYQRMERQNVDGG